jgi:hypothetical protein
LQQPVMISMRLAAAMPRRQHGDSRIKGMGCPIGEGPDDGHSGADPRPAA